MERAIITISESGKVNNPDCNIWMSFSELVVLFDVATPTLKVAIRAIHKSGVIAEHTQHCEVIPHIHWATLYNIGYDYSPCFSHPLILCGEDTGRGVKEDMQTKREHIMYILFFLVYEILMKLSII